MADRVLELLHSLRIRPGENSTSTFDVSIFDLTCSLVERLELNCVEDSRLLESSSSAESNKQKFSCRLCKCTDIFIKREELVEHFRSNWHNVNLKRGLLGLDPLAKCDVGEDCIVELEQESSDVFNSRPTDECSGSSDEEDESPDTFEIEDIELEIDSHNSQELSQGGSRKQYDGDEGSVYLISSQHAGLLYVYQPSHSTWEFTVPLCILDECVDSSLNSVTEVMNPWVRLCKTIDTFASSSMWCVIMLQSGRYSRILS